MKFILSILSLMLFLTACTPSIGVGVGIAGVNNAGGAGVAGTEIIADSETGVHGSVVMGTDIHM